jgi:hypothetical protein
VVCAYDLAAANACCFRAGVRPLVVAASIRPQPIFLRLSAHHDPQRMVWQWPLQRRSLSPWCAHPHVAFFFGGQDYRHSLGMDRLNDRIRRRRQEAVDKMRTRDRLGLGAAVGAGFGLDAGEG